MFNKKKELAKHTSVPYTELFAKWDKNIILMLFGFIFLWCIFFIPEDVLEWIALRIWNNETILGKKLTGQVIYTIGITSIITFGRFLMGEPLLSGNSIVAKFFKAQFPSKRLNQNFGIDSELATQYFLAYYDCWQFNSSAQHDMYLNTTYARYWCMFIFFIKRLLCILSVFSVILILHGIIYQDLDWWPDVTMQIFVFLVMTWLVVYIHLTNKLPDSANNIPATGCWRAWERKCEENYREFVAAALETSAFNRVLKDGEIEKLQKFYESCRKKLQELRDKAYP